MIMQLPPLIFEWVIINEPKNVNQTNEKGEHIVSILLFTVKFDYIFCFLIINVISFKGRYIQLPCWLLRDVSSFD